MAEIVNAQPSSPDGVGSLGAIGDYSAAPTGVRRILRRLMAQTSCVIAFVILAIIVVFSFGAPILSRYVTHVSYEQQDLSNSFASPGSTVKSAVVDSAGNISIHEHTFLLGSDDLGRDELTRLAYGGRISMVVGFSAVLIALAIGVSVGLISGYYGGILDRIFMRFVDAVISIPTLFILILISALVNNSPTIAESSFYRNDGWLLLPLIIGAVSWTSLARLVRAEVLVVRELDYVASARLAGMSTPRLLRRQILPNVMPVVLIWATLAVPTLIIFEASLSYLGFGARVPTPSWGNMLSNASEFISSAPFLLFPPGILIVVVAISINLLGNGLQRAFDPRK